MLSHFCRLCFATFMLVSHVVYANVSHTVSPVKQPSTMSCWAASTAMMLSYQRNSSVSIKTLLEEVGEPYKNIFVNNTGISSSDEKSLYNKVGLKVIPGYNLDFNGWYNLLSKHGPLSVTIDANPPNRAIHAIVVTGAINSSGKQDIQYVDPATGTQVTKKFLDFVKLYEGGADWTWQIMHW